MKTIQELFKIGNGPSSSHTMGPRRAAERFLLRHPQAQHFRVTLYGSLAATGVGHLTDTIMLTPFSPNRWRSYGSQKLSFPCIPKGYSLRPLTGNRPRHEGFL